MSNSENNKRIAKNTILLYFRTLITMAVSLYTSRIILNTLGVEDFGIYNVVGGVVIMFSFFNSAMSSGTQRFLSFELGKKNFEELLKVFSMSINIHAAIALIIFILAETAGFWFLNTQLTLPHGRLNAANWVYQFSILSFMLSVFVVPYNATIIAHERMNVYAWMSIVEVTLKLLIVFLLQWLEFDKLKLYAILGFGISILISFTYCIYCLDNFKECSYRFFWDKSLVKTLLSYAGWNLWGNAASVTFNQGINILLNIFFGPVVNAARGIAYQVNAAISTFVSNFQMAINPQIVKSFASGDREYLHQLIFCGSKYSFFLLYILSLPIMLETEIILVWWLKIVPEYTVIFCRLVLINMLIDSISGPLMTSAQASGKIKTYQTVVGGLLLFILPVSYFLLKAGMPPQTTLFVSISVSILALFARLWIIRSLIGLSVRKFGHSVLLPIMIISFVGFIFPVIIRFSIDKLLIRFFSVCIASVLSVSSCIYWLGLKTEEQIFIKAKLSLIIKKLDRNKK